KCDTETSSSSNECSDMTVSSTIHKTRSLELVHTGSSSSLSSISSRQKSSVLSLTISVFSELC
ncbi:hypothetical protein BgiMline_025318, partial [Biomphalaria glabrata]